MDLLRAAGRDIRLVVDYANSSGVRILPAILDELNWDVVALNATLDDNKLYQTAQEFEAAIELLTAMVPVAGANFGVRLDTGGERVYLVDDRGRRVDSMRALVLTVALSLAAAGGGTVAVPVSAPWAIDLLAEHYGARVIRTRVSPAALMEVCATQDVLMAGDGSGSFIFPQFYPISDGLFAVVKMMELVVRQQTTLSDALADIPSYHMHRLRIPCRWESKGRVMRLLNEQYGERIIDRVDGVKIALGGNEWVLIVPDADGPYFTIYAEGVSDEQAQVLAEKYSGLVVSLQ